MFPVPDDTIFVGIQRFVTTVKDGQEMFAIAAATFLCGPPAIMKSTQLSVAEHRYKRWAYLYMPVNVSSIDAYVRIVSSRI